MGMSGYNNNIKRKSSDINRVLMSANEIELPYYGLFQVTAASVMPAATGNQPYRWKYQIKPAVMDQTTGAGGGTSVTPGYNKPYVLANAPTTGYDAYSISEMSNYNWTGTKYYSYGVPETDLTGTSLLPVRIPDGTFVFAIIQNMDEGKAYYLIINTQAITGAC
jgi:hypothetical protein